MRHLKAFFILSALVLAALPWACSSNSSPTNPNNANPTSTFTPAPTGTPTNSPTQTTSNTPTRTATLTPTGTPTNTATHSPTATSTWTATVTSTPIPGISWGEGFVVGNNIVGNDVYAELQLNGQPVTNAWVVLNSPAMSGPLTLPYSGPQTVSEVFSLYEAIGGFPFQAGQPYTITAAAGGVTSTAAVTAAGGVFTVAPDGSAVSWTVDGNQSSIRVYPQGSPSSPVYSANGAGNSPMSIPLSSYASPGSYTLIIDVENTSTSVSGGTLIYSNRVAASAQFIANFVASPTPTFTPTATDTSTWTPTPTDTPTFTETFTSTGTPTVTPTATNSPTDTPTATPNPCAYVGDTYAWPSYAYGNTMYLRQYTAPVTATVLTALSAYLYTGSGTTDHYEMAVYTGTDTSIASMVPGTDTGIQTFDGNPGTGTSGWQTVTLTTPVTLTGGTPYWLGLATDGHANAYGGGGTEPFGSTYPITLGALPTNPNPLTTSAQDPGIWSMSIYGTFCP